MSYGKIVSYAQKKIPVLKRIWALLDPSIIVPQRSWELDGRVPLSSVIDELIYYRQWDLISAIPGITKERTEFVPALFSSLPHSDNILYIKCNHRTVRTGIMPPRRTRASFRVLPRTGINRVRSSFSPVFGHNYEHPVFMIPSEYGIPYPISARWTYKDVEKICEHPVDPPANTPVQLLLDEFLNPVDGAVPDWDRINALSNIRSIDAGRCDEDCIRFIFGWSRDMPKDFLSDIAFPPEGWVEPETPETDDLVVYFKYGDFTHIGRYLGNGMVLSKFGHEHIMEHDLYTVPTYYGLPRFARKE